MESTERSETPSAHTSAANKLAELAAALLALAMLDNLLRPDPFAAAAAVGLYAVRERDRAALDLYVLLLFLGIGVDVAYLVYHYTALTPPLFATAALCVALKVASLQPARALKPTLPATRLAQLSPEAVQSRVRSAMAHELAKFSRGTSVKSEGAAVGGAAVEAAPPPAAPQPPHAVPREQSADAWDNV